MGKWLAIIATFLLTLPGCGTDDTPTRLNTFTPLTSIVISSVVVTLPVGVSTQLVATGNFSGLFTRDITNQVVWSSDQSINADFPVDFPPGRIKALSIGTSTIIASLDGVTSNGIIVTVNDAVIMDLTVAPLLPSLPQGLTQVFTAQGDFSNSTTFDLTKDVIWSSSAATVATISDDFANKGKATALNIGDTTITAWFGTLTSASTTLTVTEASLSAIAVTPASSSILSLSSQSFIALGTYSDNSTRDVTTEVVWESSVPAVATVASAGIVKALTPGASTIKATLGPASGTSNLKVTGGDLQSIALTLAQVRNNELINGARSRITARGTFSNNTSRDITSSVTLTDDSANINITPMSGNLAWVEATGTTPSDTPAKIFATYGTVTPGERSLTVTAPTLNSLARTPTTLTLASGTSGRISLAGTFSSGTSQDLTPAATWSSASPLIADVGNVGLDKGRVHAVAAGISQITATYDSETVITTVTVEVRTLQSLTISAVTTPAALIPGTEKKFKVTASYAGGFEQDVTEDVEWSIDNSTVAKFSDKNSDPGLVVAVDVGTTTLRAKIGTISDTETLTVN